jgi:aryl-alcohol dehydrogenase-like predicted oxidoreductase
VAIAWLRSLDPVCLPIPGGRRADHVLDSVAGSELELSPADDAELAALRPHNG